MGSITRIHRDGSGREVIVSGLEESVEGIAIDWIAGLLLANNLKTSN